MVIHVVQPGDSLYRIAREHQVPLPLLIALPLLLILASYLVYRKFYRIDDTMYSKIIEELETRAKEESQP